MLSCTRCSSYRIQRRGTARTATNSYVKYQCNDCGAWSRSVYTKAEPQQLMRVAK